jgi:effector-binding domain-containing protein
LYPPDKSGQVLRLKNLLGLFAFISLISLYSCSNPDQKAVQEIQQDTSHAEPAYFSTITRFANTEGIVGAFDTPEMLCLSIVDSASATNIASHYSRNYSILKRERDSIGIEFNGTMGVINYNNDPNNLKFECILLIDKMPSKEPRHSKLVALEASRLLVYNYYGPYENLFEAYNEIRNYLKEHKLKQSGPVREFYITDSGLEPDPQKWLTRIFLPVEDSK